MATLFPAETLTGIGIRLLEAVGTPPADAAVTMDELVTSSLMGHDSHGFLRLPDYLDLVAKGTIVPGGPVTVAPGDGATVVVDGGLNFGQVGGRRAMEVACDLARRHQTACVITRRCNHVGRLGSYVQAAAERGLVGLATCNSPVHGHIVLPWGGTKGRLATNPLAYGVPTGGDPVMADLSTSVTPEGKIRWYANEGKPMPPGWAVTADGQPTTDARAFYGPPMGGILPLGGSAGHKGFALGLLVEILGSALAGRASTDPTVIGNGVCFIVIDPTAFCPLDRFRALMDELVAYVKSSPPAAGVEEVLVPGEIEFRTLRRRRREGVPVDEVTWQAVRRHADRLAVDLDRLVPASGRGAQA